MKNYSVNNNDFYIYNPIQSIYFIKNGLIPVEIGTGKLGHAYLKFERNKTCTRVFDNWCNRS